MSFRAELTRIVDTVVAPQAATVDRTAEFPRRAIDELQSAGILAITVPSEFGGGGLGLGAAVEVVRAVSSACGSTAMVIAMHYSATALLSATGREDALSEIGRGHHLTTLAFSEAGSRAHFWHPVSSATAGGGDVILDAHKSWVTSAHHADSYVWSSQPLEADGPMTLWFVPTGLPGLSVIPGFDGLGLRGNDSCPVTAESVRISRSDMLAEDGKGLDAALGHVLPTFLLTNAAMSVGLMQAVTTDTASHLTTTQLQHLGQSLAEQSGPRGRLARMQIQTDTIRALLADTLSAVESGRSDAQRLVLEVKAAASEAAAEVSDSAMVACGGAAFRKDVPVERRFRDARAARVMAPTTEALHDFVGRVLCGLPLLG